jgi:hypothetical protein
MSDIEKVERNVEKHSRDNFTVASKFISLVSGTLLVGVSLYGALTNTIDGGTIGVMLTAATGMFTLSIPNKE